MKTSDETLLPSPSFPNFDFKKNGANMTEICTFTGKYYS